MKYFQDHDLMFLIARETDDGKYESWDYKNKKWHETEHAEDIVRDVFTHKEISENEATKLIEEYSKKLVK